MNEKNTLYIVVPCYKEQEVLPETSKRLREKMHQLMDEGKISRQSRVMFVNDGSSDASLEICRMYARLDPRVIIIDKENTGVSGTRNVAIERATGEYLQFVDSDDQLDPNATRLLVEAALETVEQVSAPTLEEILAADHAARKAVRAHIQ